MDGIGVKLQSWSCFLIVHERKGLLMMEVLKEVGDFIIRRYRDREDDDHLKTLLRSNLDQNFRKQEFPEAAALEEQYAAKSTGPEGDMSNIEAVYFNGGGYFWVVCLKDNPAHPVGMVGLEVKQGGVGELRRMHLSSEVRGKGLGTILVELLLIFAARKGLESVFLTTIGYLERSRKFYETCGFVLQPQLTRPLFDNVAKSPDEVFYRIRIAAPRFKVEKNGVGPLRSLHHSIRLRPSKFGQGLFASEPIEENVQIWRHVQSDWGEQIVPVHYTFEDLQKLSEEEKQFALHFGYQVGDNVWEAPLRRDVDLDSSNYMNHSCEPNVWFVQDRLVSRRKIEANEEILYDYATSQSLVDPLGALECGCGATHCRKTLRASDWNKPEVRERYGYHFVPYILHRMGWFVHVE